MGAVMDSPPHKIGQLRNHSLPTTGCEPNYDQCELRCFPCGDLGDGDTGGVAPGGGVSEGGDGESGNEGGGATLCCTLPVLNSTGGNGLALLHLHRSASSLESPPRLLWLQNQTVINHGSDCVIGHTFDREQQGNLVVTCVNTTASTTDDFAFFWFLYLSYDGSDAPEFMSQQFTGFKNFPGSLSLSETRYLQASYGDCQYQENFFFVASSQGYTTNIQGDRIIIAEQGSISECWFPIDVAYIETDRLLLRVQCSQFITKLVTACGSHRTVEIYDSRVNGTIYQCGVAGTDVRVNLTLGNSSIRFTATEDLVVFENISHSHPFPFTTDVSYGFCSVGRDDLSFVFGLSNGSVLSLSFSSGRLSTLAHNSCSRSVETYTRGECYKARMTTSPGVVLAYDHRDSRFVVANLSCVEEPVVARIHVQRRPPLAEFVEGLGGSCRHSSPHPSPTSAATSEASSVSPVVDSPTSIGSSSSPVSSAMNSPPSARPQKSEKFILWVLPSVAVVLVSIVISAVIITTGVCIKRSRKKRVMSKRVMSLPNGNGGDGGVCDNSNDVELQLLTHTASPSLKTNSTAPSVESTPDPPNHTHPSSGSSAEVVSENPGSLDPVEGDKASPDPPAGETPPTSQEGSGRGTESTRNSFFENPTSQSGSREAVGPPLQSGEDEEEEQRHRQSESPAMAVDSDSESEPPQSEGGEEPRSKLLFSDTSYAEESAVPSSTESVDGDEPRSKLPGARPQSLTWETSHSAGSAAVSGNPGLLDAVNPDQLNSTSLPPFRNPASLQQAAGVSPFAQNGTPSHSSEGLSSDDQVFTPTPVTEQAGNADRVMGQYPLMPGGDQLQRLHHQQRLQGQGQRQGENSSSPVDPLTGEQQGRSQPRP